MTVNEVLKQAQPFIEWTYDKTMDVYGSVSYTKANGANGICFDVMHATVPCRVSIDKRDNMSQADANQVNDSIKLFCTPTIPITPGSKIKIAGEKFETTSTNNPMVYPTHQEVVVYRKEWV